MEKITQGQTTRWSKSGLWASGLIHGVAALGLLTVGTEKIPQSPPVIPVELLVSPPPPIQNQEKTVEPVISHKAPPRQTRKPHTVPAPVVAKSNAQTAEAQPVAANEPPMDRFPAEPPMASAPPSPTAIPPDPPPTLKTTPPAEYVNRIQSRILRVKFYPYAAKSQGREGKVLIRMTLDRNGTVLNWRVENGSGSTILDNAATQMIQRASPFPAFPSDLSDATLEMVVPIEFSLQKNQTAPIP